MGEQLQEAGFKILKAGVKSFLALAKEEVEAVMLGRRFVVKKIMPRPHYLHERRAFAAYDGQLYKIEPRLLEDKVVMVKEAVWVRQLKEDGLKVIEVLYYAGMNNRPESREWRLYNATAMPKQYGRIFLKNLRAEAIPYEEAKPLFPKVKNLHGQSFVYPHRSHQPGNYYWKIHFDVDKVLRW